MRADPDVIMVGEIRDLETAKMAADAAITGHLVFTHPAHQRRRLGGPPPGRDGRAALPGGGGLALLRGAAARPPPLPALPQAETIDAASAGRSSAWARRRAAASTSTTPSAARKCFGTGYRGRMGLYEVLVVDDTCATLVATGGSVQDIQRAARDRGVESMRDDGVRKVLEGTTSYLELLRVTI